MTQPEILQNRGPHRYMTRFPMEEYQQIQDVFVVSDHANPVETAFNNFIVSGLRHVVIDMAVQIKDMSAEELLSKPFPIQKLLGQDDPLIPIENKPCRVVGVSFSNSVNKVLESVATLTHSTPNDVIRVSGMFAVATMQKDVGWDGKVRAYQEASEIAHDELIAFVLQPETTIGQDYIN